MKALRELAGLGVGLDEKDACEVLANLIASEFDTRVRFEEDGRVDVRLQAGSGRGSRVPQGHSPSRLRRNLLS